MKIYHLQYYTQNKIKVQIISLSLELSNIAKERSFFEVLLASFSFFGIFSNEYSMCLYTFLAKDGAVFKSIQYVPLYLFGRKMEQFSNLVSDSGYGS